MEYREQDPTTIELTESNGGSEVEKSILSAPFETPLSSSPAEQAAEITPDFQLPNLVGPYRPIRSVLTSAFLHLLIVCFICFVRLAPKKYRIIDFEREKITYYDVNMQFPSIAPSPAPEQVDRPDHSSLAAAKTPEARLAEVETRIHPEIQKPAEIVVEQPEMPSVDALPKLVLPNILLKSAKAEPGKAPLVPEKPKFTLLEEPTMSQAVDAPSPSLNPESSITQKLKLALPVQPPPVVPVIDEPQSDVPVGQLRSSSGPDLLVYSNQPVLPKGELAVPKVNATGKIISQSRVTVPAGTEELERADIVISGVSIKNQTPVQPSGPGVAVIQAPVPAKPAARAKNEEQKKPAKAPSLRDQFPSQLPGIQLAKLEPIITPWVPESPLQELEKQGKTIYTTSMNSPNFTSKRGSWVFRFAELKDDGLNSGPESAATDPHRPDAPLSAPSATVKVDPKYPPEVIREKVEGQVILYAVLRKDGIIDPSTVRIIQKLDPRLDVSARNALISWKFKPSLKNGQPVEIQAEITIPFYFHEDWFTH